MTFTSPCPHCQKTLKLLDSYQNKMVRCPHCKATFKASPPAPEPEVFDAVLAEDDVPAPSKRRQPERPQRPEKEPPPKKAGSVVGILVGVFVGLFVLCGGLGTAGYFLVKSVVDSIQAVAPVTKPGGKGPVGASAEIPEAAWQTFTPEIGRCRVDMPGHPIRQPLFSSFGINGAGQEFALNLDQHHRSFHIAIAELSSGEVMKRGADAYATLADAERDRQVQRTGFRVTEQKEDPPFAGVTKRELVLEGPDRNIVEQVVYHRRENGGARVYALWVEGPNVSRDSKEVRRLFHSFGILQDVADTRPNPNPNPNPPNPNPPAPNPNQLKPSGDRLTIHAKGTRLVRYSPDGKTMAAVGEDGVLKLIDSPDLIVRATLPEVAGPVRDLAFDGKSSLLALVAGDSVHVMAAADGKTVATLTFKEPSAAAFSPATGMLAVAAREKEGNGGTVHFWDRDKMAAVGESVTLPGVVGDLAWSPDGKTLVVGERGEVHLFDPEKRRATRTIKAHTQSVSGVVFAPDGKSLVTVGGDKLIKRWSFPDGKLLLAYEHHSDPTGRPEFTPDGKHLVTYGGPKDGGVFLWDAESGKPIIGMYNTPAETGNLSLNRDGVTLAMSLRNGPVRIWNLTSSKSFVTKVEPWGKSTRPDEAVRYDTGLDIRSARFSPDGKALATIDRDGSLIVLGVADWKPLVRKATNLRAPVLCYTGDGRLVVAGQSVGGSHVHIRTGTTGALMGEFPAGTGYLRSVAASPDGKFVAVGFGSAIPPNPGNQPSPNSKGFVRVWELSDEPKLLDTLDDLSFSLGAVAFSHDGKTLLAAAGRTVRRWRVEKLEELPALEGALADLTALAVAADGRVFAGGQDRLIHSWDAEGKHGVFFEGHRDAVVGLSLTPDGKRLASAGADATSRIWDAATGAEEKSVAIRGVVPALPVYSPDGSLLAVAADYHTVSVLKPDKVEGRVPSKAPAKATPTEKAAVAALPQSEGYFYSNSAFLDDRTLLTADISGSLRRYSWPDGKFLGEGMHQSSVHDIVRSRDGKVLALKVDQAVYLRDGTTGKLLACMHPSEMDKHTYGNIRRIALSPEGDLLALVMALGQREKKILVWDTKEWRQRAVVDPQDWPNWVEFSPDGKTLAVAFSSKGVMLYDAREPKEGKVVVTQQGGVSSLAFSPDGKKIATTSSYDGSVRMWDAAEGKELWNKPLSQKSAARQSVCFSPDGKYLVTALLSQKQGLVLVDAEDGKVLADILRSFIPNTDPSFSPDGKYLTVVQKAPGQVVVFEVEKLLAPRDK